MYAVSSCGTTTICSRKRESQAVSPLRTTILSNILKTRNLRYVTPKNDNDLQFWTKKSSRVTLKNDSGIHPFEK